MTATRIGFLINAIAGMRGTVGIKGMDDVVDEARSRGATPSAHRRARAMLAARNHEVDEVSCFLGAGAYRHFRSAVVDSILQRSEFFTA